VLIFLVVVFGKLSQSLVVMADDQQSILLDADTIRICGQWSFHLSHPFVSHMYEHPNNDPVVDFVGCCPSFLFVADTTGHRFESEQQMERKARLQELWNSFEQKIKEMTSQFEEQKPLWPAIQSHIYHEIRAISDQMVDIGKTSTLTAVIPVWIVNIQIRDPRPAVIVIHLGDSAAFQMSFQESTHSYSIECINSTERSCTDGSIAGNIKGMDISLKLVRSGDFLLCCTDGILDHLTYDRHSTVEMQSKTLNMLLEEMMLDRLEKAMRIEDEKERLQSFEEIMIGLFEYTKTLCEEKLAQDLIRESELDDVGIALGLVPFFEEDSHLIRTIGCRGRITAVKLKRLNRTLSEDLTRFFSSFKSNSASSNS
jgi:hypothetical protein